ncbi:MAG: hypothetical protein JWQ38_1817 [Flavipsychrobacter sp.]|nr:hypothetical protein [Flavipsychrobacter sp.]
MNRVLSVLLCFFATISEVKAQVLPKEGSALNYRLIGFSPFSDKVPASYKIEIASGEQNTEHDFHKNIIKTITCKTNKVIAEVPSFGQAYTWRTVISQKSIVKHGVFHHFTTVAVPDPGATRVSVTVPAASQYKNAYVLLDANKAMYDMAGNMVWHLPNDKMTATTSIDLKTTPFGTITFIMGHDAYEIDYNGTQLWKGPNNGKVNGENEELYHHEFTRLSNGNYMVLGNESLYGKLSQVSDTGLYLLQVKKHKDSDDSGYLRLNFGTIIEYNKKGDVVWSWKSSDYFKSSDLSKFQFKDGIDKMGLMDMHENAFSFDEQQKAIYVSFKNISRIVKIRYPDGVVLTEFGEKYMSGVALKGNGLFSAQHACKHSAIGCLFLFNNNGSNKGGLPKLKIFKEPEQITEKLKKIWEYDYIPDMGVEAVPALSGGNIIELPDSSLFVSIGGVYGKLFIVNKNKKTLWSATAEQYNTGENKWLPLQQYRASIIYDRKQLEKLVWGDEKSVGKN